MTMPAWMEQLSPDALAPRLLELWDQAMAIWRAGGWAMPAIAAVAMLMFALIVNVYLKLRGKGFQSVPQHTWRRWLADPAQRKGPVGRLLDFVTGARSLSDLGALFRELRATEVTPFDKELRLIRVCVSAAPLLGLLGTVTGMLATFSALAGGSGGEKTMGLIAAGISEALITTETGLVVALPGLIFQYQISRKFERYKAFLAQLETACTQELYRSLRSRRQAA
jgi:biopolymer transport protein ExbB